MTLLGLSPLWFAAGLAGLAAALFVLHLLRVRLRRVEVETLLFFADVAAPARPRVLRGPPKRLLAYLLGLATLSALWLAFVDPVRPVEGRSRVVLVEASGRVDLAEQVRLARDLAARGLGPRGAVLAFQGEVVPLLQPGEAPLLITERARALHASGPGAAFEDALALALRRLVPGDEIALLGGPAVLPEMLGGVKLLRITDAPAPVPPVRANERAPRAPVPVNVAADLPECVRLAVRADPELTLVEDGNAELRVARAPSTLPTLVIETGLAGAEREPLLCAASPIALSLRDRRGTGATLTPRPGETVWVSDARSGRPLVAAHAAPVAAVRVVEDLLVEASADIAHRDVPRLVLGALRMLAGLDVPSQAIVGERCAVPAATEDTLRVDGPSPERSFPERGAHALVFAAPGAYTVQAGPRTHTIQATLAASPARTEPRVVDPERAGGNGHLLAVLLWLALALLVLDIWLYHRGRLP